MCRLSEVEPLIEVLPPTAAGKPRAFLFWPDGGAAGLSCRYACVVQERGKADTAYGIDEVPVDGAGRLFLMRKTDDPVPYSVFCSADGHNDDCSCTAGCYAAYRGVVCKHLLTIRGALANGWIAPDAADYPADEGYDDADLDMMAREYSEDESLGRFGVLKVA